VSGVGPGGSATAAIVRENPEIAAPDAGFIADTGCIGCAGAGCADGAGCAGGVVRTGCEVEVRDGIGRAAPRLPVAGPPAGRRAPAPGRVGTAGTTNFELDLAAAGALGTGGSVGT